MNKHLELVFRVLLPALEKAGVDYWVYGGVAVASYAGEFIRENPDVDIFVKEEDFNKTKSLLKKICSEQENTGLKECNLLNRGDFSRHKLEVKIDGRERLSVVPVYLRDDSNILVFGNGAKGFSKGILEKTEKDVSGYRFFTPPNKYIREIFLNCFRHKTGWEEREDVRKDAKIILSPEEFEKRFFV